MCDNHYSNILKDHMIACKSCDFLFSYDFFNKKTYNGKSYQDLIFYLFKMLIELEDVLINLKKYDNQLFDEELLQNYSECTNNLKLYYNKISRGEKIKFIENKNENIDENFIEECFFIYYCIRDIILFLNEIKHDDKFDNKFLKWSINIVESEFRLFNSFFSIEDIFIDYYNNSILKKKLIKNPL